ncbi:MAG: DUF4430 domain-containing protein [Candidatus Nanohalobium sp.]
MDLTERLDRFTEQVNLRYVGAGALIVLGLVLMSGLQLVPQSPEGESISVNLSVDYGNGFESRMVRVNNSSTAFHALNSTYPVDYRESSYGYFITSINGVSGGEERYWIYKVNGRSPEVGAGQYSLTEGDNLSFKLLSSQEAMNATG